MQVDFVGHPLVDTVKSGMSREEFLAGQGLSPDSRPVVGILPGSRSREFRTMMPIFLEAARLLELDLGPMTWLVPLVATLGDEILEESGLRECKLDIRAIRGNRYELMAACDAVMAASGTVTLELGILRVPMVVAYRVSPLTHFIGHRLIKVKYASLVNLVAGREVVPELLQYEATPEKIARTIRPLLADRDCREAMQEELRRIAAELGDPGASERAAAIALELAGWTGGND